VLESPGNRGKGHATRRGMLEARGERILFSDADLSTPIEEVEKLERRIERGADVAIASRGLARSNVLEKQPFYREGMGRIFNLVMRIFVLPGLCDTQCGFKLFTREAARAVFPLARVDGWAFDVEVLYLARRMGFRIAEVPARWLDSRASKVNLVGGPLTMLRDLARIRLAPRDGLPVRGSSPSDRP